MINTDTGETTDITSELSDRIWHATAVGNWTITGWALSDDGYEISETATISVTHGAPVIVNLEVEANTATSGDEYDLTVTGTDSDNNTFFQSVLWKEGNAAVPPTTISGSDGNYSWSATSAGIHVFTFTAPNGVSDTWTVDVNPNSNVETIVLHIHEENVLQLETFEIWVQTYDAWDNEIPVPPSTEIMLTGRMEAKQLNSSNWEITTLDEGEQTVTVVVYGNDASGTIQVDGTFMGFFKSGGPLYYAGAGLGVLVIIVLLVVVVLVLRSGDDEWDDEYDDEDDEEEDDKQYIALPSEGPSGPGPGGPPPGASPEPEPEEDTSWMVDHRVDDEGTEWAEDESGVWWYRDQGTSEWSEWSD